MNTYSEYKDLQGKQNTIVDMLSDKLNSYPKGDFGMIEENVRMSDEFRFLNSNFNKEFKKLQEINRFGVKKFKKEMAKERDEKINRINAIYKAKIAQNECYATVFKLNYYE